MSDCPACKRIRRRKEQEIDSIKQRVKHMEYEFERIRSVVQSAVNLSQSAIYLGNRVTIMEAMFDQLRRGFHEQR